MKQQANKIKRLNFINNKQMVSSILNQQIFQMSSLQSSLSSSGLNFSTFRSSDFISFLQHSKNSSPNKSINLCKLQTNATISNIRQICFRNNSKIVAKILNFGTYKQNSKIKCNKIGQIRRIDFKANKQIVNKILCK